MAEYLEGGDQQAFFDEPLYIGGSPDHSVGPVSDGVDMHWPHASDILPTEVVVGAAAVAAEQTYMEGVYGTLGFTEQPTTGQLQELWGRVEPEDRMQRTYIIEALRGHRISFHDLTELPAVTYFTLLWGGSFEDVVKDLKDEQAQNDTPPPHEVYGGIYSD